MEQAELQEVSAWKYWFKFIQTLLKNPKLHPDCEFIESLQRYIFYPLSFSLILIQKKSENKIFCAWPCWQIRKTKRRENQARNVLTRHFCLVSESKKKKALWLWAGLICVITFILSWDHYAKPCLTHRLTEKECQTNSKDYCRRIKNYRTTWRCYRQS